MFDTGESVGLAEWIIEHPSLVISFHIFIPHTFVYVYTLISNLLSLAAGITERKRVILQHPLNGGRKCPVLLQSKPCPIAKCKQKHEESNQEMGGNASRPDEGTLERKYISYSTTVEM